MDKETTLTLLREEMVRAQLAARGIRDEKVLAAFRDVPRHAFVPPDLEESAYTDHPLPIGEGQTISQPLMVATMTEELHLRGGEKILEIGTGSGYQTAILAKLIPDGVIYSIERIASLSEKAKVTLDTLGFQNIRFRVGDGSLGWPEEAPFDRILVAAAAPAIPSTLVKQLSPGGILTVPVGEFDRQDLMLVEKDSAGRVTERRGCSCVFVKLIGAEGWDELATR